MEASLEIQSALLSRLELEGFRVYDFPPKDVPYPFILIGDDVQSDLDVKNADYLSINSTILVFDDYKGKMVVKTIMEHVRKICYDLELETYKIVGVTVGNSFTAVDDKNQVTQGVLDINFRLLKGVK